MKCKRISLTLAASLALGLASCSKNEPVTTAADDANKAASATADARAAEAARVEAAKLAESAKAEAARAEAAKFAEAAKAEVARAEAAKAAAAANAETVKTADVVKAEAAKPEATPAEAAKATDNGKAQALIDKAKSLVAENKFSDASSVLQQLAGQALDGDQTKLVDGLKEQIQKALAARAAENAAGAAGGLFKK